MGENLSEAPKADSRGENLIKVPLLSPQKKKKTKEKKKRQKQKNRLKLWKLMQVAGIPCRKGGLSTQG